jgi:hypothetical protein
MGCMSCLYICLYAQFEILQTTCCLRVVHALSRKKILISPFSFLSLTHSHSTIIAVGSMQQKDLSLLIPWFRSVSLQEWLIYIMSCLNSKLQWDFSVRMMCLCTYCTTRTIANTNVCVCLIVIPFQHFKVYFTFFGCTTRKCIFFKNHLWSIGHNSESIMSTSELFILKSL